LFIWTFETQVMAKRRVGGQTDSLTPDQKKVKNRPDLLVFKWRATYRWKALDKGYKFSLDHILIRVLLVKLCGSKVVGVPTWAISWLPLGNLGTKNHLDVGPMERCKVYYKGEGGGFPQVRAMVSLVCPCCSWLVLTLKMFQLRTNHLVWVLCRPVWMSEACQLFLVPFWSSSTPLYPLKCCELGSVPRLLPLFSTWTHIWILQGVGSASPLPYPSIVFTFGLAVELIKEVGGTSTTLI